MMFRRLSVRLTTVKRVHQIVDAKEGVRSGAHGWRSRFPSPSGAGDTTKDEMVALLLEEKGIFVKTQLVVQRVNLSKLVGEFVRVFKKRLSLAGPYQPELPQSANGAGHAA
jgi:hypothetical protein